MEHYPVMAQEVLAWFRTSTEPKVIIDATIGAGGHSALFLKEFRTARIVAVDADARMIERARQSLIQDQTRVSFNHMWFDDFFAQFQDSADRILLDLGVSLFHLALSDGGFSIREDGPLDMRLNAESGVQSAADLIRTTRESELADIIYRFGEERHSRRIARAIVRRRESRPFTRTADLASVVAGASVGKSRRHPATRTFQAIRIAVNDELGRLARAIPLAAGALSAGGRLAIISFHSLEDRIVKRAFRALETPAGDDSISGGKVPMVVSGELPRYRVLTRKPQIPGDEEISVNAPSRSAKLRVLERVEEENDR